MTSESEMTGHGSISGCLRFQRTQRLRVPCTPVLTPSIPAGMASAGVADASRSTGCERPCPRLLPSPPERDHSGIGVNPCVLPRCLNACFRSEELGVSLRKLERLGPQNQLRTQVRAQRLCETCISRQFPEGHRPPRVAKTWIRARRCRPHCRLLTRTHELPTGPTFCASVPLLSLYLRFVHICIVICTLRLWYS